MISQQREIFNWKNLNKYYLLDKRGFSKGSGSNFFLLGSFHRHKREVAGVETVFVRFFPPAWIKWQQYYGWLLRLVSVHVLLHIRVLGTCFHLIYGQLISAFKPSVRSSRLSFSILILSSSLTLRLSDSCLFLCWPCFEISLRKHVKLFIIIIITKKIIIYKIYKNISI